MSHEKMLKREVKVMICIMQLTYEFEYRLQRERKSNKEPVPSDFHA